MLLSDFPDDDPREAPDPNWRPPTVTRGETLEAEVAALDAPYARSCVERGRTTVGLSGLTPAEAANYAAAWLAGASSPLSPIPDMSPILALRFAVDDLKAYALEAAIAGDGRPSSQQLGDWLWDGTATGAAIRELRRILAAQEDERAKLIAGMFLVPALRVAPGG